MDKQKIAVVALFMIVTVLAGLLSFVYLPAALGLVLGVTVALIVFFKPFYGLIMYIILIYVMPQVFFPPLQKLRIMLVMATLILLVFFIHKIVRKERISFTTTRHSLLMFFLLMIVPISNIANFRLKASLTGFNEFLTVFLLYFLIVNLTTDFDKFRKVCWTLVICTLLLSLNGLLMRFRGYDIVGNTPIDGRIHWMSHFGDPNDFALAINSFLPFALINLFEKKLRFLKKIPLIVIGCIFLVAVFYTNSRGGYVALLGILAFFAYKRWGLIRGAIIGAAFVVIAIVFAPSRMADISPHEASASGRVNAWIAGLGMLRTHPIFGIGHQNFIIYHIRAAHSAYIQCMSELGIVGYFTWLALLYTSYSGLRRVEKYTDGDYLKYAKILQLSLIGFLLSAVFLSQAYSPILYIIIALSSLLPQFTKPPLTQSRKLSRKEFLHITAIMGGSIVAYMILAVTYV